MALRTVRVRAPQIKTFANVDQISSNNYRSYIDSTEGSSLQSAALAALQIPGGRTVDQEIERLNSVAASQNSALNDPSRRSYQVSPYDATISRYRTEMLKSAAAQIEQQAKAILARIPRVGMTSGNYLRPLDPTKNPMYQQVLDLRATAADPAKLEPYAMKLGGREVDELNRLMPLKQTWDSTANAGITKPMSEQERTALQQQMADTKNQVAGVNAAAADRLKSIASQFNQGVAGSASALRDAKRPLVGRFGTPETGVGISIGGFR
jgi:hypothetical protein